jgi:hypothetical protein
MAVELFFRVIARTKHAQHHTVDKETIRLRLVGRIYAASIELQVDRVILKMIDNCIIISRVNRAGCHHWNKNCDWLHTHTV